jgi:hypothetical protein
MDMQWLDVQSYTALRIAAMVTGPWVAQHVPPLLAGRGGVTPDYGFAAADMLGFAGRAAVLCAAIGLLAAHGRSSGPKGARRRAALASIEIGLLRLGLTASLIGLTGLLPAPRTGPESAAVLVLTLMSVAFLSLRLGPATAFALRGLGAVEAIAQGWRSSSRRPFAAARLAVLEWLPAALVTEHGWRMLADPWVLSGQPWTAWDPGSALTPAPTAAALSAGLAFAFWARALLRWEPARLAAPVGGSGPIAAAGDLGGASTVST